MGKIFKALEKLQIADDSKAPFCIVPEDPSHEPANDGEETTPTEQGTVISGNLDPSLLTHFKPHSLEAEQFRILKTNILFPDKGVPPRSIMITSSTPGDGKSFVASNLAVSIANSIDEYVLLMDCDLRRPSIHSRFGFSDIPGLSEYLSDLRPLSSIIKKTQINKLSILPAGVPPSNPSELVSSEQMRLLLNEVKTRYDDRYIIIDSPPPYLTSEASALARQVDGIVIVVKTGKTKKEAVQDLIDTYGKKKILGVVKNFSYHRPGRGYENYGYK
ncbi:MAG: polysaccharide biosynthesis tyrosine autokinase [Desulfobacteraceae bacterium]|nr:polysaccharide biosynthesis tyrosine autokinase [Desulfobacteraceae bacterium]